MRTLNSNLAVILVVLDNLSVHGGKQETRDVWSGVRTITLVFFLAHSYSPCKCSIDVITTSLSCSEPQVVLSLAKPTPTQLVKGVPLVHLTRLHVRV